MYLCLCAGIDEKKILEFLKTDPNENQWQSFLSTYNISKDCGTCIPSLTELKNKYKKSIDHPPNV